MSERYRSHVDIHLILRDGDRVLLGERRNTGFMDGSYHLPAGHLEDGESATTALVREAKEEIGVGIDPVDVVLVHLMHHRTNAGRVALFYEVTDWTGEPENREPDKCAGLKWFQLEHLPTAMIPYAEEALRHYVYGELYSERGWEIGDGLVAITTTEQANE